MPDTQSAKEADDSTVDSTLTPSETVRSNESTNNMHTSQSSCPMQGSTFIIHSASDSRVLTLLNGAVVFKSPGTQGAIHWTCVEDKGWLGFKNVVSGRYLGHDSQNKLVCKAEEMKESEQFCLRPQEHRAHLLLMRHQDALWHAGLDENEWVKGWGGWFRSQKQKPAWNALWRVGVDGQDTMGWDRLAKVAEGENGGIGWHFVKVYSTNLTLCL